MLIKKNQKRIYAVSTQAKNEVNLAVNSVTYGNLIFWPGRPESDVFQIICERVVFNDGLLRLIGRSDFSIAPRRGDRAMNGP